MVEGEGGREGRRGGPGGGSKHIELASSRGSCERKRYEKNDGGQR